MKDGDSKDFKGDSDDLLSQLLDLEDVISQPGSDTAGEDVPFDTELGITKDQDDQDDHTEMLGHQEAQESEQGSSEQGSVVLDEFLKEDANEDAKDEKSDVEFFSDQLQELARQSKIQAKDSSFEEELDQTILDQARPFEENPFSDPVKDKTIVLDAPLEEASETADEATDFISRNEIQDFAEHAMGSQELSENSESDPIEEALAEFSSEQGEDLSAASISNIKPNPVEEHPQDVPELQVEDLFAVPQAKDSQELAESDFADVFQSGPIQVHQKEEKQSALKIFKNKVHLKAASIFFLIGLVGFGVYRFFSEDGLFGYRLDGFSLEAVYSPPSDEQLAIFSEKIAKAKDARLLDDPNLMEAQVPELEAILDQDERNLEAAQELLETLGLLIAWKGIQTSYPEKFEQVLSRVQFIESKLFRNQERPPQFAQSLRAKVWKSLEVGETQAAVAQLETSGLATDDASKALLGEMYYRKGDSSKAKEILGGLPESWRRASFYRALINDDRQTIERLAKDSYWPAKIEIETTQAGDSLQENLARFDRLLEQVKDFPWLAARVQGKLGDVYQSVGQGKKAREYWMQIVKKSPDDYFTWKKLAKSYREDSEWDESLNAYRSAIKAGGLQKDIGLEFVNLLRTRLKVVEALDIIDQALQKYPKSPEFYYEKGETQLAIYQEEPAKLSFQKALEFDSGFEPAILSLAQLAVKQQDYEKARDLFSKIPESSPNYSGALVGLGRLFVTQRKFGEAKRYFERSIKTNPKNEDAYDQLVKLLLRDEEDEKAMLIAEEGVRVLPKSPKIHLAKARVLSFRNQYPQAREEIHDFLRTHNHYLPLVLLHVEILIAEKKYSEARDILDQYASKEASEPEILYFKAWLNYQDDGTDTSPVIGSKEAAFRQIQTALNYEPENERYLGLHSRLALILDERMQAFEIAERLKTLYPDNATAYEVQGDVYFYNGNNDEALKAYQKAQSLTRFKGPIFRKLASVYKNQGQTAKAIQYYLRLAQLYPSDALAYHELGKLYNEEGRYSRALEAFHRASQLQPSMAEPYYYMGFIQKELGNHKAAVRSFEKYLALEPNGVESATVKDEIYFLRTGTSSN